MFTIFLESTFRDFDFTTCLLLLLPLFLTAAATAAASSTIIVASTYINNPKLYETAGSDPIVAVYNPLKQWVFESPCNGYDDDDDDSDGDEDGGDNDGAPVADGDRGITLSPKTRKTQRC